MRPVMLMLHGLAGHGGEWDELAALLSPHYRVLAPDQRGAENDDMSRQAYVDDAIQLLAEPAVLCGQSLGGHTAMLVAAARPDLVSALIMIEAGPGGSIPELPQQIGRWIDSFPVPFKGFEEAVEFFGGGKAGAGWARGLEQREDGLWPRFNRDAMVASVTGLHPYWTEWESITCPILVIRAANGTMSDTEAERMSAKAHVVTIPEAGHDVHLEQPQAVYEAIRTLR